MTPDDADIRKIELDREEVLFEEGDPPGPVFFLLDGAVEIVVDDRPIARVSGEGEFLGEMSALLDLPRTATVRASSPTTLLAVDSLEDLMRVEPGLSRRLARGLARRLQRMNERVVALRDTLERADREAREADGREAGRRATAIVESLVEDWDTRLMDFHPAPDED